MEDGCLIQNNQAIGGNGIQVSRTSYYAVNGGDASGGGLYVAGGSVALSGTTVSGNLAQGGRGGFSREATSSSMHAQHKMGTMKSATLHPMARAALDRLLDPLTRRLTPAAARLLVEFRPDPDTIDRIAELAEKCNEGELTAKEGMEYAGYVRGGDLITVLQSKARRFLKSRKR